MMNSCEESTTNRTERGSAGSNSVHIIFLEFDPALPRSVLLEFLVLFEFEIQGDLLGKIVAANA